MRVYLTRATDRVACAGTTAITLANQGQWSREVQRDYSAGPLRTRVLCALALHAFSGRCELTGHLTSRFGDAVLERPLPYATRVADRSQVLPPAVVACWWRGCSAVRPGAQYSAETRRQPSSNPDINQAEGGGCAGEGPKYGDEGARRQGRTRHTPEREVTSQPPSSSTLGYYSALQPGMCWCGHGRDSVGPIHHPPALPQHTPMPPGGNPGSPCPTRHPNPPCTQL